MNARKILDSSGAWEGLSGAKIFQGILAGELLMQIAIVQVRRLLWLSCCCGAGVWPSGVEALPLGRVALQGWLTASVCCLNLPGFCCNKRTAHPYRCLPHNLQFGGPWFNTHPLDGREWAVCVGLGATTLGLRELLRRLPYGR